PHADPPPMNPKLRGSGRSHSPNAHPPTAPPVAKIHVTVVCVPKDQSVPFSRVYCHWMPAIEMPSTAPRIAPVAVGAGTPRWGGQVDADGRGRGESDGRDDGDARIAHLRERIDPDAGADAVEPADDVEVRHLAVAAIRIRRRRRRRRRRITARRRISTGRRIA